MSDGSRLNPPRRVPEATLSATIVGIDDFSLGFVQTYLAEHFRTDSPTIEQLEAALRALEDYGGYHGLKRRR
jgi:hypothetical protein